LRSRSDSTTATGVTSDPLDGYIHRFLNTNGMYGRRDEFLAKMTELRSLADDEPRMHIDGHHYMVLLTFLIKPHVHMSEYHRHGIVARAMVGCLDYDRLARY